MFLFTIEIEFGKKKLHQSLDLNTPVVIRSDNDWSTRSERQQVLFYFLFQISISKRIGPHQTLILA